MPKVIHIANAKKRDAEVAVEQHVRRTAVRTVLPDGEEKSNVRLLKNTIQYDITALLEQYDGRLTSFEDGLIEGDPEIDFENVGRMLRGTHKLYVDQDRNIAYRLNLYQVVYGPGGEELERHDINKLPANINTEYPLKWTGRRFDKSEALRRFVFFRKYQLRHINGVTFDFLYNMARELQDSGQMVLVGAGPKGTDPVLLTRGGSPYRGFLEGRALSDRYALILHLSDIELKPLEQ
ncbi:MAG: hypothetical protein LUE26_07535 [Alistipes sp.]|nr:hypothetical protein [Alistipes sp.]